MNGTAAPPEGRIEVRLRCRAGRVHKAQVRSSRTRAAEHLFAGRALEQVLRTVPLLFGVCATAQGCAAVAAAETALGITPTRAHDAARRMLVLLETAREHLWRVLLDWPGLLGAAPEPQALAAATPLFRDLPALLYPDHSPYVLGGGTLQPARDTLSARIAALTRLLERTVFSMPIRAWKSLHDATALSRWYATADTPAAALLRHVVGKGWEDLGRCDVQPLPHLPGRALHQRLKEEPQFTTEPLWEGTARETGPFTRQRHLPIMAALTERHGNGLLARLVARLRELADIPGELSRLLPHLMNHSAQTPAVVAGFGVGLAQVEAARGLLVHRVELGEGLVRRYQMLAPTEWNFHPRGVVAKGLQGLPADDDLEQRTRLLLQAVDPCVGWRLEVERDA